MSKEMWLIRDEAWTVFDWKPIAGCLGSDYFNEAISGKKVFLSDEEYADYEKVLEQYIEWQKKLANLLDN